MKSQEAVGVTDKDAYFVVARRFDTDAVTLALGSARRAWWVAGAAIGLAIAAVFARQCRGKSESPRRDGYGYG